MTATPQPSKSRTLRVTTRRSRDRAIAAIIRSGWLRRLAGAFTAGKNFRVGFRSRGIERPNSSGEVTLEDGLRRTAKTISSPPFGQYRNAGENFGLANGSRGEKAQRRTCHPLADRRRDVRSDDCRENIGIQQKPQSNFGGSRSPARDGNSSISIKPNGAKRARILLIRSAPVFSLVEISRCSSRIFLRMLRTSASIERPCSAARTRNLSFRNGSSLRW
jgi:hypothetical protein